LPGFHDECAVFGIWGDPEAGRMAYLGLFAQQHRGQESSGIVTLAEGQHRLHKGLGLVGEVFNEQNLVKLIGEAAIGHNRYSTTGANLIANAQPLAATLSSGPLAIAHNGNIVNAAQLREELIAQGSIFQGTNDTEVVLHLLSRHANRNVLEALKDVANRLEGAYSFTLLTPHGLVGMRDPYGFRPLVMGRRALEGGGSAVVLASETCAFDLIGAKFEREIAPGEIFVVSEKGEVSTFVEKKAAKTAHCVFEHVYFSRPDSFVFGKSVYEARKAMGRELAKEQPVKADLVVPVPDSGVPAALGYSAASGIPFELGIIRNHYIGRTFIQPSQSIRSFGVKIKLNPQTEILKGKSVVVIDDSLVRGTTSKKIVSLIRQAGAREVHFRLASPPTMGSCYYGVDTPKRQQLIASHKSIEEIRAYIEADTLGYLSAEGLMRAVGGDKRGFCAACFTGEYPTPLFGLDADRS
jgi:amidophosphoribosyltransferase